MNSFVLRALVCLMPVTAVLANVMTISLKKHKLRSSDSRVLNDAYGEVLHGHHDVIYRGIIAVGTPPKEFKVIFDTGSGVFWLPAVGCRSKGPHAEACKDITMLYDPKNSTTARETSRTFKVYYSTGSAEGKLYYDDLKMGDLSKKPLMMKSVPVGAAERIRYIDYGVIGLSLKVAGHPKPVFIRAYDRGLFTKPIFTTYMKKCEDECEDGGMLTLGDFDYNNCNSHIDWTPVITGTSMWRFQVNGVTVGNFTFDEPRYYGITDTGSSYIHFPSDLFEKVIDELEATKHNKKQHLLPCDSKFSINFNINGKTFTVTEKEVLLNQGFDEMCVVAIGDAGQFEMFLLGDSFIRGYCQVYDIQQKRVGFAKPLQPH